MRMGWLRELHDKKKFVAVIIHAPRFTRLILNQGRRVRNLLGSTHPTFTILRKINFLIWDRIWPALGYFQAIGVLGMQFWALFGVSDFYLFRQVWSLTNLWPCSNLGFPRSIFIFFAPNYPARRVENGWPIKKKSILVAQLSGFHRRTLTSLHSTYTPLHLHSTPRHSTPLH